MYLISRFFYPSYLSLFCPMNSSNEIFTSIRTKPSNNFPKIHKIFCVNKMYVCSARLPKLYAQTGLPAEALAQAGKCDCVYPLRKK